MEHQRPALVGQRREQRRRVQVPDGVGLGPDGPLGVEHEALVLLGAAALLHPQPLGVGGEALHVPEVPRPPLDGDAVADPLVGRLVDDHRRQGGIGAVDAHGLRLEGHVVEEGLGCLPRHHHAPVGGEGVRAEDALQEVHRRRRPLQGLHGGDRRIGREPDLDRDVPHPVQGPALQVPHHHGGQVGGHGIGHLPHVGVGGGAVVAAAVATRLVPAGARGGARGHVAGAGDGTRHQHPVGHRRHPRGHRHPEPVAGLVGGVLVHREPGAGPLGLGQHEGTAAGGVPAHRRREDGGRGHRRRHPRVAHDDGGLLSRDQAAGQGDHQLVALPAGRHGHPVDQHGVHVEADEVQGHLLGRGQDANLQAGHRRLDPGLGRIHAQRQVVAGDVEGGVAQVGQRRVADALHGGVVDGHRGGHLLAGRRVVHEVVVRAGGEQPDDPPTGPDAVTGGTDRRAGGGTAVGGVAPLVAAGPGQQGDGQRRRHRPSGSPHRRRSSHPDSLPRLPHRRGHKRRRAPRPEM